jgi:hypothetical protein
MTITYLTLLPYLMFLPDTRPYLGETFIGALRTGKTIGIKATSFNHHRGLEKR